MAPSQGNTTAAVPVWGRNVTVGNGEPWGGGAGEPHVLLYRLVPVCWQCKSPLNPVRKSNSRLTMKNRDQAWSNTFLLGSVHQTDKFFVRMQEAVGEGWGEQHPAEHRHSNTGQQHSTQTHTYCISTSPGAESEFTKQLISKEVPGRPHPLHFSCGTTCEAQHHLALPVALLPVNTLWCSSLTYVLGKHYLQEHKLKMTVYQPHAFG